MINEQYEKILMTPRKHGLVTMAAEADLPTSFGNFKIIGFKEHMSGKEHTAIIKGEITSEDNLPCRIHSECHTGDVLGSLRCDCRQQLEASLRYIESKGRGIVLYLRQEGRGIGLINKINAYRLQEEGLDTVEANEALGLPAEARQYALAADMLTLLGVNSIQLLSNNPVKFDALKKEGITINARVPIVVKANDHNRFYLDTKRRKMNHDFAPGSQVLVGQPA
jgi:GTP cyclohydrolase II